MKWCVEFVFVYVIVYGSLMCICVGEGEEEVLERVFGEWAELFVGCFEWCVSGSNCLRKAVWLQMVG